MILTSEIQQQISLTTDEFQPKTYFRKRNLSCPAVVTVKAIKQNPRRRLVCVCGGVGGCVGYLNRTPTPHHTPSPPHTLKVQFVLLENCCWRDFCCLVVNNRLQEAAHLAHLRRSPHVVSFKDLFLDLTLKRELSDCPDPKNV
jgi:hypothetical protein